jgi:nucleoside-diphosphate-sugar epimerase
MAQPAVLVTGCTGFVAGHIIDQLLEKDLYTVRGTARNLSNGGERAQHVVQLAEKRGLTFVLPETDGKAGDLHLYEASLPASEEEMGNFDECVKGCETVIHTASPYTLSVDDPQKDLVDPAVLGTLSVLESCWKSRLVSFTVSSS